MDKQEINLPRCRDLRQIEERIREETRNTNALIRATQSALESARREHARKFDQIQLLLPLENAANVASSTVRGPAGKTVGVVGTGVGIQVAMLKDSLDELARNIQTLEIQAEGHRSNLQLLEINLKRNADEMRDLNCVI